MQKIKLYKEPRLDAKYEAFPFQSLAVEFVCKKEYSAVFYEQGLGKTKIAIDVILDWLHEQAIDTAIVVTKKGLVQNWLDEFTNHSYLNPRVLSSNKQQNYYVLNSPARVVISHFEAISSEVERLELFCKLRTTAIIIDESAKLKNPNSKLTQNFFRLAPSFSRRVIMTGTPIPNRPEDIWSQIYFLDQGKSLGSDYVAFKKSVELSNRLAHDEVKQTVFENNISGIFPKISSFCIRETKAGSGLELPGKVFNNILCDWDNEQFELYQRIKVQERVLIKQDGRVEFDSADYAIKRLTRLLQVASNPKLIDECYDGMPGKFQTLSDLLSKICAEREKAIVWTSFVRNAEWLKRQTSKFGSVLIHGGIRTDERIEAIQRFQKDPQTRVLIAVPAAAKEGLTLTVANHVIFWDRSFSLDDYLQAQDRIHRISQTKTCYVDNLIMKESIDEWVDVLLEAKASAAKLSQSDIDIDQYRATIDYSYGDLIVDVLGLSQE